MPRLIVPTTQAPEVLVSPVLEPSARTTRAVLARWVREAPREARMLPLLARDYLRAGPRRAMALGGSMRRYRLEEAAPQIEAPTLVVRGGRDPFVSREWAEHLVRLLPDGRLALVPDAAHAINYTQPRELAGVVQPFLAA